MHSQNDLPTVLIAIIAAVVIGFAGLSAVSTLVGTTDAVTESDFQSATRLDGPDRTVQIPHDGIKGTNERVYESLGRGLAFRGSGGLSGDAGIDLTQDNNWTVSQGVWLANNSTDQTIATFGDPNLILRYDASADNYQAVWTTPYGPDAAANVSAPGRDEARVLQVTRDGQDLTIYSNSTLGESVNISQGSFDERLVNDSTLNGTVDETRVFQTVLNNSERQTLYQDPIAYADPSTDRQLRIMYDTGSGSSVELFYAPTSAASFTGGSWATGFAADKLERDGVLGGDYRWTAEGPAIEPTAGGELAQAPVAWVLFDSVGLGYQFRDAVVSGFGLVGILFVLAILGVVIYALPGSRSR